MQVLCADLGQPALPVLEEHSGHLDAIDRVRGFYLEGGSVFSQFAGEMSCVLEAVDADPDGPRGAIYSRLIWGYTARLARDIKKRWPDKILVASFYSRWADGPGDIKLPDNVTWMIVYGADKN